MAGEVEDVLGIGQELPPASSAPNSRTLFHQRVKKPVVAEELVLLDVGNTVRDSASRSRHGPGPPPAAARRIPRRAALAHG